MSTANCATVLTQFDFLFYFLFYFLPQQLLI
jgi:hypothetical protein